VFSRPEQLRDYLLDQSRVVYSGIDPTADSLHVGHILPMMCLVHFQIHGHKVIPLVSNINKFIMVYLISLQIGGATALIGDPSGRSTERPLMEEDMGRNNMLKLSSAVQKFFERARDYASKRVSSLDESYILPLVMNNIDWFKNLGVLDFLRVAGANARVNSMIARER
jgi:tyrosyl-tRNA synthetase